MRLRVPLVRSLFIASKPKAMPIMGTSRIMRVTSDGITFPEVVKSPRKTNPSGRFAPRMPWEAATSPAALANNINTNNMINLILVK